MNKIHQLGVLLFLSALPFISNAQESTIGNWLLYIGNKQIDSKWNLHHEIQYRNYNAIGDLEQLLIRTGIGYTFQKSKNNLLLGYGFIHSGTYVETEKVYGNEHRIFQQFIHKSTLGAMGLSHRFRLEERFIPNGFDVRFRYFTGITVPLKNQFYGSFYNEIFISKKKTFFDRNRTYAGLGIQWSKDFKTEIGYMNQWFSKGSRDQINVICFYNL